MYNFIDTTEALEGKSLPSEALKINGEYIENLIEGYRTLTVEGREALSPEILTNETGIRDGSTLKGKRYPARVIRITYQLIAATSEDFREAYNKLAKILDVEDAELIFNDETDKFFTGTPSYIGEVPPGKNSVVGEFEILCVDPFKYSVMEYVAVTTDGEPSVMFDYNGTYKSYPKLEAEFYKENAVSEDGETLIQQTGNGECGYVAFFTENEKIIQLGNPDEADTEVAKIPSVSLLNHKFDTSASWGSGAKSKWLVNSGITSSNAVVQVGTPGMSYTMTAGGYEKPVKQLLLSADSKASSPFFHYEIYALQKTRSSDAAQVEVTINVRLDNKDSYFKKPYVLTGQLIFGGVTRNYTIKGKDDMWLGTQVHSKTFVFNLSVSAQQESISGSFAAARADGLGMAGTLSSRGLTKFELADIKEPEPDEYFLTAKDYGTGSDWHGPSITRTVSPITGNLVSSYYTLTYKQIMYGETSQLGACQIMLVSGGDSGRKIVAGVSAYKGSTGTKANLRFYVNGKVKGTVQIDLSQAGSKLKLSGSQSIIKTGAKVQFKVAGLNMVYTDPGIADIPINEITCTFSKFGTKPALKHNGISWVKLVQDQSTVWRDIPNKFSTNDVVEADCKTGEIFLNGASTPALGALGNDWEDFCLTPGINQIGFSYSDWVDAAYAPTFKVKYREVFL